MEIDSRIIAAIITVLLTTIFGFFLGWLAHRRSFKLEIFKNKKDVVIELSKRFNFLVNLFHEVYDKCGIDSKYKSVWDDEVLSFLGWIDENKIFISEDLAVNIGCSLVGAKESLLRELSKKEAVDDFVEVNKLINNELSMRFIKINTSTKFSKYYKKIKKKSK